MMIPFYQESQYYGYIMIIRQMHDGGRVSFHAIQNYLNQPYLQLCVESIINCCGKSFHICLIDDNSFSKLIPDWKIDFDKIANPVKTHMRTLAMSRVLYYYGGLLIPNSTLVLKDLSTLI